MSDSIDSIEDIGCEVQSDCHSSRKNNGDDSDKAQQKVSRPIVDSESKEKMYIVPLGRERSSLPVRSQSRYPKLNGKNEGGEERR